MLNTLKYNKTAADDIIRAEILRNCDFEDEILDFCNGVLMNRDKPEQFSNVNLIPVPKKGDLTKTGNYRGIAISSVVAKLLNKMILKTY